MATNNALNVQGPTPAFSAYNGPDQATGAGNYVVQFGTELYDISNNFDIGTGIFTAPLAGIYNFNCCLLPNTQAITTYIDIGGTGFRLSQNNAAGSSIIYNMSGQFLLNASDQAKIVIFQGGATLYGATATAQIINIFSGYLVIKV